MEREQLSQVMFFLMKSTPPFSLVTRAESGVLIRSRSDSDKGAGI